MKIEKIEIIGLHGSKNIKATLQDNTLILVGENGSGKTTFLRVLFHLLAGRWFSLLQYKFTTITLTINGEDYQIARQSLADAFQHPDRRILSEMPPAWRNRLRHVMATGDLDSINLEMERVRSRFGISMDTMVSEGDLFLGKSKGVHKELFEKLEKIREAVGSQILYLPTYRRIERELKNIFEGFDPDQSRTDARTLRSKETGESYIELVEFGMKDVERAIGSALQDLKEFARESLNNLTLSYLGDVVDQEYLHVGMQDIAELPEETIKAVLDRIHEGILTELHKDHLLKVINSARSTESPDEHSKIISHYFLKLFNFQKQLQARESNISAFCAICSAYTAPWKSFIYDPANFSFVIRATDESNCSTDITLSDLSSGEKQIVSLFSHLYLSGRDGYFVLIDEPELSLSVPWQRRFLLDIKNGGFCNGLIAVTHSPFIYENELCGYAHSLGEFVSVN